MDHGSAWIFSGLARRPSNQNYPPLSFVLICVDLPSINKSIVSGCSKTKLDESASSPNDRPAGRPRARKKADSPSQILFAIRFVWPKPKAEHAKTLNDRQNTASLLATNTRYPPAITYLWRYEARRATYFMGIGTSWRRKRAGPFMLVLRVYVSCCHGRLIHTPTSRKWDRSGNGSSKKRKLHLMAKIIIFGKSKTT
jgi:hypothetical protein